MESITLTDPGAASSHGSGDHHRSYNLFVVFDCARLLWGLSMGFVMDLDAKHNILRVTIDGHVTDAILFDGYAAMAKYLASHSSCHSIGDFSPVMSADISSEAVRQLAAVPPLPTAAALRILVSPKDSVYGMARMFQIRGEETRPNFHIVRTLDEAYSLLQVKSPEFSPLG